MHIKIFQLTIWFVAILLMNGSYSSLKEPFFSRLPCPAEDSLLLLDNRHLPKNVWIGVHNSQDHIEYVKNIITTLIKNLPEIKITLVGDVASNGVFDPRGIDFVKISYDSSLWIQDYFEIVFSPKKQQSILIDLPHFSDKEIDITREITSQHHTPSIPFLDSSPSLRDNNGNYGGNIEPFPGNIIAHGDNISPQLLSYLKNLTHADFVELKVGWLQTGHVDEMITHIPIHPFKNQCDFMLVRASPLLAISILGGADDSGGHIRLCNRVFQQVAPSLFPDCAMLIESSLEFENIIQDNSRKLKAAIEKKTGCTKIMTLRIPQLFVDSRSILQMINAIALNTNAVNLISLKNHVLLPEQPFIEFKNYMESNFKKFGLYPHFFQADHLKSNSGGMHCNLQIARSCRLITP